ncbi:glycoside hydrolase family 15 protein [soil metagenome]
MSSTPIADHALISDCHSAGLVSKDGSVEWLCLPRFDSPSTFARILDDRAGHWSIRPVAEFTVTRRYLERTMVLETTFRTGTGTLVLVDALAFGPDNRDHGIGEGAPHLLLRRLTVVDGEVEVEIEYAPRTEYGLVHPLLRAVDGGVVAKGGADALALSAPLPLEIDGSTARATLRLSGGEPAGFALHHGAFGQQAPSLWTQDEIVERLEDTIAGWRSWSALHQRYEGPYHELVHQSGRVLQALRFQPTGAIVAAATTSLPETIGGERNWDYRYAWVRDASFTIEALWVAACPDEAHEYFNFMSTAAATSVARGADLQIMFGIGGERDLTERHLPHLSGWRDSAPVRVGNGAWDQRQLDVYGELLGAVTRFADHLELVDEASLAFFVALADGAAARWHERDQGIWEVRGEPRHFVYSKLMCWVALDRAIAIADRLSAGDRVEAWAAAREEIAAAILDEGWSERAGAFTQAFGSDELDASNLMLSLVGFLPPDDPRVLATIDATEAHLTDDLGLVYRYRGTDGLGGEEGTFLLCTFWLAQAMALSGQPERARGVFDRAVRYVNDVGLLAEEVDPATGELLGNFPQAFSHIGLVNAAWAISKAERAAADGEA